MAQTRKLIEVSLPLDAINAESARKKCILHGQPCCEIPRKGLRARQAIGARLGRPPISYGGATEFQESDMSYYITLFLAGTLVALAVTRGWLK